MIKLTPAQFGLQWSSVPHMFDYNVENFKHKLAEYAIDAFNEPFVSKEFKNKNGMVKKWAPRKRSYPHPMLHETGSLMSSIKSAVKQDDVTIYTDPSSFMGARRHKGFCYAAIHNEGIGKMPKRQFIGHSALLWSRFSSLSVVLFCGIPARRLGVKRLGNR